jgi:hypothetical protein
MTIVIEMNGRLNFLREDLASQSAEDNDPEQFIKFHSTAYQKLDQLETDDYHFHIYQVIAKRNDVTYDQFTIFVIPKTDIQTAETLKDSEDQTQIVVTDVTNALILYQTVDDSSFDNYAISYGIRRVGLYYHTIEQFNYTTEIEINLYDYDYNLIFTHQMDYMHGKDPLFDDSLLLPAYTQEEVEDLLDLSRYTSVALLENYTIFLIADILLGSVIYYFIRRKKS